MELTAYKSYSVTQRSKETNWWAELTIIDELNKKDNLTEEECEYLDNQSDKAASWVMCACGNQCNIIPRTPSGAPVDPRLGELGRDFYCAVKNRRVEEATNILENIEKRSEVLIKEELARNAYGDTNN